MKKLTQNKSIWIAGLSGVSLTLLSLADLTTPATPDVAPEVVNTSNITPFEAGKPATAASMNATIQELMRVIDINANALQQVKDRVVQLETQASNGSVAGRTYKIAEIGVSYSLTGGVEKILTSIQQDGLVTITFGNEGSSVNGTGYFTERSAYITTSRTYDLDNPEAYDDNAYVGMGGTIVNSDSFSGSFTQNGNTVVVSVDGENTTFYVSNNGQSIMNYSPSKIMTGLEITSVEIPN